MHMEIEEIYDRLGRSGAYRLHTAEVGGHSPVWLTFPVMEEADFAVHAFTTRFGGVSEGNFAELNLGMTMEAQALGKETGERNHLRNYSIIAGALERTCDDVVISYQTHTKNVRRVTSADAGKGVTRERDYRDVDALVTDEPGLLLVTLHADCTPVYFADPVHRTVGVAHSGWRGTAQRICAEVVSVMRREFGTRPEDLLAQIGPVICESCYEVGQDVAEIFRRELGEEVCSGQNILRPGKDEAHSQLDLAAANRYILLAAGLQEGHVGVSGLCTCCHSDIFFSHRGMKGKPRGNLGALITIRK